MFCSRCWFCPPDCWGQRISPTCSSPPRGWCPISVCEAITWEHTRVGTHGSQHLIACESGWMSKIFSVKSRKWRSWRLQKSFERHIDETFLCICVCGCVGVWICFVGFNSKVQNNNLIVTIGLIFPIFMLDWHMSLLFCQTEAKVKSCFVVFATCVELRQTFQTNPWIKS